MDLTLAKTKSIGGGSNTSVVTFMKEKPLLCRGNFAQRRVKMCERNCSADTKVSEERGGGGAPGTRAEIALQPMRMNTVVRQAVLLQLLEIHLQPVEDPTPEQVDARMELSPRE
ncbi:protein pxr1-like [Willisornis vidua]|uniref:Protein pxr1-like n=1 Tax=Willisornis vidua TaxID=1566151 RepID=A0ABQ9DEF5_9PASS|nr:protein pxr1-like [Willisornis vidua]